MFDKKTNTVHTVPKQTIRKNLNSESLENS